MNGEINGKGKQYDNDGNLLFEGEYLNGKRWNGKGKKYSHNLEEYMDIKYLNGEKIY